MKKLFSLLICAFITLNIMVMPAFGAEVPRIPIHAERLASDVKVEVNGLQPNTPVSFQAFYTSSQGGGELWDFIGQYITDDSGAIAIDYLSTRTFEGGDVLRVIIGGGGLTSPLIESHTIYAPITSIKIDASVSETVERGEVYRFGLILNEGPTGKGVVWTVSDPSLAIIEGDTIQILNRTGTTRLIATDPVSGLVHSITLRIAS